MIKPEHVPLKVIHALVMNLHKPWPDAIAAALNAWPGSEYVYKQPHRLSVSYSNPAIILPLPQENPDDQA